MAVRCADLLMRLIVLLPRLWVSANDGEITHLSSIFNIFLNT